MSKHPSQDTIIVLEASIAHEDPNQIVESNVWFVNALLEEHLTTDEIAADALRSYYVDYYLAQVCNGGFSQFVYNSRWDPLIIKFVHDGLRAMGAKRHIQVFEEGARLVDKIGPNGLERYFASEYFGENVERDRLNALDDSIITVEKSEDLRALNAAWLRSHPNLRSMPTVEMMSEEARRRGRALPDRERRIAEARAMEPRYMKLIRSLCDSAGHELERVTIGDPMRIHEGARTVAWHFITNKGHHHMVDTGGSAIMFRGQSTTERVCEVPASEE